MKTALVISQLPTGSDLASNQAKWQDFSDNVKRIGAPPSGTSKLTGNVWQIPLANGLPFLCGLIQAAGIAGISIQTLILDEPPEWIKIPPTS